MSLNSAFQLKKRTKSLNSVNNSSVWQNIKDLFRRKEEIQQKIFFARKIEMDSQDRSIVTLLRSISFVFITSAVKIGFFLVGIGVVSILLFCGFYFIFQISSGQKIARELIPKFEAKLSEKLSESVNSASDIISENSLSSKESNKFHIKSFLAIFYPAIYANPSIQKEYNLSDFEIHKINELSRYEVFTKSINNFTNSETFNIDFIKQVNFLSTNVYENSSSGSQNIISLIRNFPINYLSKPFLSSESNDNNSIFGTIFGVGGGTTNSTTVFFNNISNDELKKSIDAHNKEFGMLLKKAIDFLPEEHISFKSNIIKELAKIETGLNDISNIKEYFLSSNPDVLHNLRAYYAKSNAEYTAISHALIIFIEQHEKWIIISADKMEGLDDSILEIFKQFENYNLTIEKNLLNDLYQSGFPDAIAINLEQTDIRHRVTSTLYNNILERKLIKAGYLNIKTKELYWLEEKISSMPTLMKEALFPYSSYTTLAEKQINSPLFLNASCSGKSKEQKQNFVKSLTNILSNLLENKLLQNILNDFERQDAGAKEIFKISPLSYLIENISLREQNLIKILPTNGNDLITTLCLIPKEKFVLNETFISILKKITVIFAVNQVTKIIIHEILSARLSFGKIVSNNNGNYILSTKELFKEKNPLMVGINTLLQRNEGMFFLVSHSVRWVGMSAGILTTAASLLFQEPEISVFNLLCTTVFIYLFSAFNEFLNVIHCLYKISHSSLSLTLYNRKANNLIGNIVFHESASYSLFKKGVSYVILFNVLCYSLFPGTDDFMFFQLLSSVFKNNNLLWNQIQNVNSVEKYHSLLDNMNESVLNKLINNVPKNIDLNDLEKNIALFLAPDKNIKNGHKNSIFDIFGIGTPTLIINAIKTTLWEELVRPNLRSDKQFLIQWFVGMFGFSITGGGDATGLSSSIKKLSVHLNQIFTAESIIKSCRMNEKDASLVNKLPSEILKVEFLLSHRFFSGTTRYIDISKFSFVGEKGSISFFVFEMALQIIRTGISSLALGLNSILTFVFGFTSWAISTELTKYIEKALSYIPLSLLQNYLFINTFVILLRKIIHHSLFPSDVLFGRNGLIIIHKLNILSENGVFANMNNTTFVFSVLCFLSALSTPIIPLLSVYSLITLGSACLLFKTLCVYASLYINNRLINSKLHTLKTWVYLISYFGFKKTTHAIPFI